MRFLFSIFFLILAMAGSAQDRLRGVVVNAETGDTLRQYILQYKRFNIVEIPDSAARFDIVKLADYLTVYAPGFQELRFLVGANTPGELRITLRPEEKVELDSAVLAEIKRINSQKKAQAKQDYFKFDPLRSLVAFNGFDGFRARLGGQTTGKVSSRWFFKGYAAHGWKSQESYYNAQLAYSFNKKEGLLTDYPRRSLAVSSTYDLIEPSAKAGGDESNVLSSLRWTKRERLLFLNRQKISFDYDFLSGLSFSSALKIEKNSACEALVFPDLHTTELSVAVSFSRTPLTVFSLSHQVGMKLLGGDENYHHTEASVFKRFELRDFGALSLKVKGGVQWNEVPAMLLLMPAANISYFMRDESFSLMHEMEFLTDRYLSADLSWSYRHLLVGAKSLWGSLSQKNRQGLPDGCCLIDGTRPYNEVYLGVDRLFGMISVQYVRRLNYLGNPWVQKDGLRFSFETVF